MNTNKRRLIGTAFLLGMLVLATAMPVKAANLWLNKTKTVLYAGYHTRLVLNGTKKKVTWTSSNPKVATVEKDGTVTAVKKGKATITATRKKKQFTCQITVKKNPYLKAVQKAKERVSKKLPGYTSRSDERVLLYTGVPAADYMTEVLVQEIGITGDMTDEQILEKAYRYMAKYFYYLEDVQGNDPLPVYYNADELKSKIKAFRKITDKAVEEGKIKYKKKYSNVVGTIESHQGVCNNHASVFSVLCRHLGIEAGLAGGSYWGYGHTWSWVKLDGKKYYFDIGTSIHHFHRKTKKVTMNFFKLKKKKMKKKMHYHFSWER